MKFVLDGLYFAGGLKRERAEKSSSEVVPYYVLLSE